MDKIAIISDVHANITALKAVLADIHTREISKIYCLGDSVLKSCNPDLVIDLLRENCDVILKGNCDDTISLPNNKIKKFWTREKIGEERASFLYNLPLSYDFYISGRLVRLFHACPQSLYHIYNPMFSNNNSRQSIELTSPELLFENTEFIGKDKASPVPDVVGYGHIHTPNIFRFKNKLIFNTGSVGMPVEMLNNDNISDNTNCFSTVSSYIILEGILDSKELSTFSVNLVRVPYDIFKEIELLENSDMPGKENVIYGLRTASSNI